MVTQNVLVNTKCWLWIGTHHSCLWWLRLLKRCLNFFIIQRGVCAQMSTFLRFSVVIFPSPPHRHHKPSPKCCPYEKSREKNLATMTLFKFFMFIFGLHHLYCLFYIYKWSEFKFYLILLGFGTWEYWDVW